MKQVGSRTLKGIAVMFLLALFLSNGIAAYLGYAIIPNITKVISIIVLLTLYYTRLNHMATVFLTIFIFTFLGDVFSVFNFGELANKLSITFYLGGYSLLIFVLLGKLKRIKYEGLVSLYLVLVLLLNSYFLYMLYGALKDNFTDNVNLVLYICHGITLIAMTFFAFAVYLSKESTQSIIFLIMVFCMVFSDVLNYICNLYVYYWVFDFFSDMLHLTSLCLFYTYVTNHHKIIKVRDKMVRDNYVMKASERLTA
ncbi:MAG: hypothetical protein R2797_08925 [Gelidibacter sp.]